MQAAAKQFRGDFFVAIDQPVGKFVRIEAPFLNGDVGVRGDAVAMPAVRNGRKGLVIRLVKLDADSLGIPIQEQTKDLSLDEEADDGVQEFDAPQVTIASNVSAAVAKSIRAVSSASDRAQPVKLAAAVPSPIGTSPSQPTRLEDLDDEAREAVSEFGDASTRASDLSADLAKKLAEPAPVAAPHTVRRTPETGIPVKSAVAEVTKPDSTPPPDDDAGLDSAFGADIEVKDPHGTATSKAAEVAEVERAEKLESLTGDDEEPVEIEDKPPAQAAAKDEPEDHAVATAPSGPSKAATTFLVALILIAMAAAAFFLIKGL